MRIALVTPAARGTRYGNRVTALRWARILRSLGHGVKVITRYQGEGCDLMVGLHARRSAESMHAFKKAHPHQPLVLALTGTDVYQDIRHDAEAQRSLELADRIVALQSLARNELSERLWHKFVPIVQSAKPTPGADQPRSHTFDVCVVGYLRPVKDPIRAAMASRLLPSTSRVRVLQLGGALSSAMERRAKGEQARNPRYVWLGERPHWQTRRIMKRSRLLVLSSQLEGGANVLSEALADQIPVLSSRIPGSIGLLGEDHPGYFTPGGTRELARLLRRAETNAAYLGQLRQHSIRQSTLVRPEAERASWQALLGQLMPA